MQKSAKSNAEKQQFCLYFAIGFFSFLCENEFLSPMYFFNLIAGNFLSDAASYWRWLR